MQPWPSPNVSQGWGTRLARLSPDCRAALRAPCGALVSTPTPPPPSPPLHMVQGDTRKLTVLADEKKQLLETIAAAQQEERAILKKCEDLEKVPPRPLWFLQSCQRWGFITRDTNTPPPHVRCITRTILFS